MSRVLELTLLVSVAYFLLRKVATPLANLFWAHDASLTCEANEQSTKNVTHELILGLQVDSLVWFQAVKNATLAAVPGNNSAKSDNSKEKREDEKKVEPEVSSTLIFLSAWLDAFVSGSSGETPRKVQSSNPLVFLVIFLFESNPKNCLDLEEMKI